MSSTTPLGPLVRLEGISIKQLPADGKPTKPISPIATQTDALPAPAITPNLKLFLTNVLIEAIPFIDSCAPKSGARSKQWRQKGSSKKYASSDGPVELYERTVSGKELDKVAGMNQFREDGKAETWYCRRSLHRNAAVKGTADWEEFKFAFKDNHPATEDAFTPTVIGAREALVWDCSGIEIELDAPSEGKEKKKEIWTDISLAAIEMKHKIDPKPLKNRTFPIIQITAALAGIQEFIVVSIPLTDFDKSPHSEFAKDKSLVVAAYVSIERIRMVSSSGEIEWVMATASDAGGVLPQWMQNLVVPGMLPKDVEMFMSWIPGRRNDKTKSPMISKSATNKSLPDAPGPSETASLSTVPPPPISKTAEEEIETN